MRLVHACSVAVSLSFVLLACASTADDAGGSNGSADALSTTSKTSTTKLLYEGTCAFLHQCDSYSKKLPEGQVEWGCGGAHACADGDLWVAGPSHAYCNKSVQFCVGSKCTTALVRDVSVSANWEASNGVLDAIGLSHNLTGRCSGSGGGTVTTTFPAPASAPIPVDAAASTPDGSADASVGTDAGPAPDPSDDSSN